jgi:hypothetical protein
VFDATIPIIAKEVEPYRVQIAIHKIKNFGSERDKLGLIDFAFEDGILDALPVVEAEFGDASQAARTARAGRGDIVGDEDLHEII